MVEFATQPGPSQARLIPSGFIHIICAISDSCGGMCPSAVLSSTHGNLYDFFGDISLSPPISMFGGT